MMIHATCRHCGCVVVVVVFVVVVARVAVKLRQFDDIQLFCLQFRVLTAVVSTSAFQNKKHFYTSIAKRNDKTEFNFIFYINSFIWCYG